MKVSVECGADAAMTPRRFRLGERWIAVADVIDRWHGADHDYVKLAAADGATYILRHDRPAGDWELWLYERPLAR